MQLLTSIASAPFGPLELTHSWTFLAIVARFLSIASLVLALLVIGTVFVKHVEKTKADRGRRSTFITLGVALTVVMVVGLLWAAAGTVESLDRDQIDAQRNEWNTEVFVWAAAEYGVSAGVEDLETPHWEACAVDSDTCYSGLLMVQGQPVEADLVFVGDQPVLVHHDGAHKGEQLTRLSPD